MQNDGNASQKLKIFSDMSKCRVLRTLIASLCLLLALKRTKMLYLKK